MTGFAKTDHIVTITEIHLLLNVTYSHTQVVSRHSNNIAIDGQIRLEPIMLKNLPIIPSRTSQKFYPLLLIYSQIITYYSFIILLILLGQ